MNDDKDSIAWRDIIKEYSEKWHTLENNLQNIHTPFDLVYNILGKLKEYTEFNNKTFCVFNLEFIEVLCYDFGVPLEKIWFLTDCKEKEALLKVSDRYNGVNIMRKDIDEILKKKSNEKKFDVVVGNPPYQAPKDRKGEAVNGTCGAELWDKFVKKSTELVKENGFVALIHPPKWRKPDHDVFRFIHERDLKYLEIHSIDDGLRVFRASTAYDWYILKNSKYSGKTIIKDVNGNIEEVDISNFYCIPSGSFNLFKKILAKDGEEKCEVIYSYSIYDHRKPYLSKVKDEIYKYPVVYGLTQKNGLKLLYSDTNNRGQFGIKKVIVPLSKYTNTLIDKDGEYGMCEFAFGIKFDTPEEAEGIKKAIMSERFKAIWQATEWICNSKEWRIFKCFKKDFWKEFINNP